MYYYSSCIYYKLLKCFFQYLDAFTVECENPRKKTNTQDKDEQYVQKQIEKYISQEINACWSSLRGYSIQVIDIVIDSIRKIAILVANKSNAIL